MAWQFDDAAGHGVQSLDPPVIVSGRNLPDQAAFLVDDLLQIIIGHRVVVDGDLHCSR